jgi:hypothetical protein
MTEQRHPDPSRAGTLAQQIVTILVNEDTETRKRAIQAAMALLGESLPGGVDRQAMLEKPLADENDQTTFALFFNRGDKLKPAEYAYLCAAYHYSKHGPEAFSLDELRAIAKEAGVVLPDRLDMTLKQAGNSGKKLFQSAGRDAYKPTASAGVLFNERWQVKPGKGVKRIPNA